MELFAIDDHVCIQKVRSVDLSKQLPARDTQIMDNASRAYRQVGLVLNDDKKRRLKTSGVLLAPISLVSPALPMKLPAPPDHIP